MILCAFVQQNQNIIFRPIDKQDPVYFESLIHEFNSKKFYEEGKITFERYHVFYGTAMNITLAITCAQDIIYELDIQNVIKNILTVMINDMKDPFEEIEDTIGLIDNCLSDLTFTAFKPETLTTIKMMDSYDEKVYIAAVKSKEIEDKKLMKELGDKMKNVSINKQSFDVINNLNQSVASEPNNIVSNIQENKMNTVSTLSSDSKDMKKEFFEKYCKEIRFKPAKKHQNVHFRIIEKVKVEMNKEGKIQSKEINGELTMYMTNSDLKEASIEIKTSFPVKYSPNLLKDYAKKKVLKARNSFPIEKNVVLVRWKREDEFDDFNFNLWQTEEQGKENIIMDYEKSHDLSEILFFFNSKGKNLSTGINKESVIWKSQIESDSIEFLADKNIFPIKVYYCGNRKCAFDILKVSSGKDTSEKYDVEYFYEVDDVKIVE